MATRGVNKVILVGNLGNDPEVRYMPSGDAVASITIATSETWKDKANGQQREKTEWHRVRIFGKSAEFIGQYARKGTQVYAEGKLETRKWQDQNTGQDRFATEVVVRWPTGEVQIMGRKQDQRWGQPQQPAPQQNQYAQAKGQPQPQYNEPPMDFDDDIPFAPLFKQYRALSLCV